MRKLKELISDTLIYGISSVFARFINYLLVPLYTGVFNPEAYGIVGLVYAAIAFLNVLFTMGMESAYLRYAKNRTEAAGLFKSIQVFLLGVSLLLIILLWIASPLITPLLGLTADSPIFLMMLGILLFDTLSIVPFAELRFIRKAGIFALLKTGNVIINLSLNFYLILGLEAGIEAVFISNLVASFITALIIGWVTRRMLQGAFTQNGLKKALLFGLPFIPAGIGHVINEMLDRFFIKGMSPEEIELLYGAGVNSEYLVGIYNACYKLAVFMLLLVQMYRMAWQPFFMRKSEDQDAPQLFAQSFSVFNVVAAVLFLTVALFLEQIVSIKIPFVDAYLIGEEYWSGLIIVPVLLMAYWFQGWYVNFSAGIFIAEQTSRLATITLIGASVTIVANIILLPLYGLMGAATATLISYFVMAMLIFYYSKQAFHVPYKLLQGIGVVAISGVALLSKPFLTMQNFSDFTASLMVLTGALLLISLISYSSIFKRQEISNE